MHHRKLNLSQPILASSRSRTSVLAIAGVKVEGRGDVPYLRQMTSLVYSSTEMGCD